MRYAIYNLQEEEHCQKMKNLAVDKHCPVFCFAICPNFLINNVCKTSHRRSLVRKKRLDEFFVLPCELEIWVLELLMTYAPAKICRDFYKKVSACHLEFSEYFKIKCYQTCRGLYSFVLPLSSPRKTRTDASQTLFTGWMCVPHSPPMA